MSLRDRIEARQRADSPWCRNCGSSAHTFCNRPVPQWLRLQLERLEKNGRVAEKALDR